MLSFRGIMNDELTRQTTEFIDELLPLSEIMQNDIMSMTFPTANSLRVLAFIIDALLDVFQSLSVALHDSLSDGLFAELVNRQCEVRESVCMWISQKI